MQEIVNKIWDVVLKQGFTFTLLAVLVVVLYRDNKDNEAQKDARIKDLEERLARCMEQKYYSKTPRRNDEDEM